MHAPLAEAGIDVVAVSTSFPAEAASHEFPRRASRSEQPLHALLVYGAGTSTPLRTRSAAHRVIGDANARARSREARRRCYQAVGGRQQQRCGERRRMPSIAAHAYAAMHWDALHPNLVFPASHRLTFIASPLSLSFSLPSPYFPPSEAWGARTSSATTANTRRGEGRSGSIPGAAGA